MHIIKLLLIMFSLAVFQTASANISVKFVEGAPKDRFIISNIGVCDYQGLAVKIDLTPSAGKLIFDTTAQGEGVEVFQPFENSDGSITLVGSSYVMDGQKSLSLAIATLGSNESVSFTIDVDDTLLKSELGNIRVSRSEMNGSTIEVEAQGLALAISVFDNDSVALISNPEC